MRLFDSFLGSWSRSSSVDEAAHSHGPEVRKPTGRLPARGALSQAACKRLGLAVAGGTLL